MAVRVRTWTKKDGTATKAYVVERYDAKGKRCPKQFKKHKDALEFDKTRGSQSATIPSGERITIAQAAEIWIEACKVGRHGGDPIEPSTMRQYENHVNLHIVPRIGNKMFSDMTAPEAVDFRDELLKELSRPLAKKVLTSVKSIFGECSSRGFYNHLPFSDVKVMRSKRREGAPIFIPEPEDVSRIISKAVELAAQKNKQYAKAWRRYSAIIQGISHTGMRPSEARGLYKSHFNPGKQIFTISQRADENGSIGPPKSEAGYREIVLPSQYCEVLEAWLEDCPKGDLLFPNWQGKVENLANIHNRGWLPLLEKCKIKERFTLKGLRHFHASVLIDGGANAKEVQTEMGHSSINVTYDIYGHLFKDGKDRRREMAQRNADKILKPQQNCNNEPLTH